MSPSSAASSVSSRSPISSGEGRGIGSAGSISSRRYRRRPVAAGMSLPMITFSLRPSSLSVLPSRAASVSTLVVSWNEAAERKESVASEAFVIPRMTSVYSGCAFFAFFSSAPSRASS